MEEDAAAGRPLLAALCVSKTKSEIPAPGFFEKALALGVYSGSVDGSDALAYHASELRRVYAFYENGARKPLL